MRISTNVASLQAQQASEVNKRKTDKGLAELASGSRINKAADDAAGLAMSKNMDAQLRSASQAMRNSNDAISLIQIAEGSFNELNVMMVRLRELGVMAGSDTLGDLERNMINREVVQLKSEMDRISQTTTWGHQKLLSQNSGSMDFQIGYFADPDSNQVSINLSEIDTRTEALGVNHLDFTTKEGAQTSLADLDQALNSLGNRRATIGAIQNRLNHSMDNLGVASENLAASNSRLKDTDVAQASTTVVQGKIMAEAGVATLSQANINPQVAMKLI